MRGRVIENVMGNWKRGTGKRGTKLQDWKTREKARMESQMVYFTC